MSAMGAVRLRLRAELRRQWRVWLALAVLLAVVPGWTAARIRPALILRSE